LRFVEIKNWPLMNDGRSDNTCGLVPSTLAMFAISYYSPAAGLLARD
jgi:hypothetical protein